MAATYKHVISLALLCVFLCDVIVSTDEVSVNSATDEQLETFTLDEPLGRSFVTVNGSNIITTPNFVVGIALIGISIALLFGSAASAASVAAASTLAAGSNLPGKYKRSIQDSPFANPAAILKTLAGVEQQFKNFDVTDVDCRKRIICEIHQEGANGNENLGSLTNVVLDTFNSLSLDETGSKFPFLQQYVEAAQHGKSQRECSQVYNTCDYSVKNVLRNLRF